MITILPRPSALALVPYTASSLVFCELVVARASGGVSSHVLRNDDSLSTLREWKESRIKSPAVSYVGLDITARSVKSVHDSLRPRLTPSPSFFRGVYTCTTSGHLRLTKNPFEASNNGGDDDTSFVNASLPMRLCDFHLSPDAQSFAYGGDEVDLSLWDAEAAFTASTSDGKTASELRKRKKPSTSDLLPGEVWRAKNVRTLSGQAKLNDRLESHRC